MGKKTNRARYGMDWGAIRDGLAALVALLAAFLAGAIWEQRRILRRLMQAEIDRQSAAIREAEDA